MEDLTPTERDRLQDCRPPGWDIESAEWDASNNQLHVRIKVRPRGIAPLVGPDQETPTVEPAEPTVVEGSGATRSEALDNACQKLGVLAPR